MEKETLFYYEKIKYLVLSKQFVKFLSVNPGRWL